jgi:hypothetical protein
MVGGVVEAGDDLMLIVPHGGGLTIKAKIAPQNIDQSCSVSRSADADDVAFKLRRRVALKAASTPWSPALVEAHIRIGDQRCCTTS